jgi:hypothetical protein
MLPFLFLLQDEDLPAPLGSFMDAVPHSAFIIIHSVLSLVAIGLWRRTKNAGFLLFVIAELCYITYHAHLTHFLFAHLIAEVCVILSLVTIGLGFTRRPQI